MNVEFPHPGVSTWKNPHGITIFRLHYSADPDKTAEWAAKQKAAMTNEADYEQEYEINFSAKLGTLIYQLHDEATLENSFPIPKEWTRYFALDPHPVVPHAGLWLAMDKWGDAWAYRELWPSKIYGQRGNVPEDDNRFSIKQYVETVQWLESADNPENEGQDEDILAHSDLHREDGGLHQPGKAGKRGTETEYKGIKQLDVDAERAGHFAVRCTGTDQHAKSSAHHKDVEQRGHRQRHQHDDQPVNRIIPAGNDLHRG